MNHILITGGAGFVGVYLTAALLKRGYRVRVLDNFSCSRRDSLKEFGKRIEIMQGDVRDAKQVRKALRGLDAVFHLAAIRSVVKSVENPFLSHDVNATGCLVVLDEAKKAGIQHVIFTSTSAVYGNSKESLQREDAILNPISPYGVAKLAGEGYARHYFYDQNLPTTSVRIFNVYGPRQNPESKYSLVVPGVLARLLKNQSPVIDGTGEQSRDFIYIGDVVEAFFKILGTPKAYGKVYNLGSGKSTSIRKLVDALIQLSGVQVKASTGPRRPGDPERTCADIRRIKKDLGWSPRVSLEEGLKETLLWAKK